MGSGSNPECWKKVAMILNIIVSCIVIVVGVNYIFHWLDYFSDVDLVDSLSILFYGLCVIVLGLMLLFVEIKYEEGRVKKEFGLLCHYLGRGSFVFFISILAYSPYSWMWGGKNGRFGVSLGLISAIIQWSMHSCMGIERP